MPSDTLPPLPVCEIRRRGKELVSALGRVTEDRRMDSWGRKVQRWIKLRGLLEAASTVPVYRKHFSQHGFSPEDVRVPEDLGKIPILDKGAILGASEEEMSRRGQPGGAKFFSSSGSTGVPCRVARSSRSLWNYVAWNIALHHDWCRGRSLTKGFYLLDLSEGGIDLGAADLLRTIVPDEQIHSGNTDPGQAALRILKDSPEFISSYPSALRAVANSLRGKQVESVQIIHLTSETLDAHVRALIARSFPLARVVETYASTECGLVAYQCPLGNRLHVAETNVIAEIVDEQGQPTDDLGRLVVTDLTNDATPIIRYRGLGDLARWDHSPCPCGTTVGSIVALEGRTTAILRTKQGEDLPPFAVTSAIEDVPGLAQYQVVQKELGMVEIRVVPLNRAEGGVVGQAVADTLGRVLGDKMDVRFVVSEPIHPKEGTHKIPLVISELGGAS